MSAGFWKLTSTVHTDGKRCETFWTAQNGSRAKCFPGLHSATLRYHSDFIHSFILSFIHSFWHHSFQHYLFANSGERRHSERTTVHRAMRTRHQHFQRENIRLPLVLVSFVYSFACKSSNGIVVVCCGSYPTRNSCILLDTLFPNSCHLWINRRFEWLENQYMR